MLTPEHLESFNRDGFVHGGRLLDDEQVDELRAELDRLIARYDRGDAGQTYIEGTAAFCQQRDCFLQFTNVREVSEPFRVVTTLPPLLAAGKALLDAPSLRLFADGVLYKRGQNPAVNDWHQDGPSFDILREPEALTAWVALDDVGEGDGGVCFARGSHRWVLTPAEARRRLTEMQAEHPGDPSGSAALHHAHLRRGDVHFHHGLTWHCSLANRTGRPRRGFAVHYIPTRVRFAAEGRHFFKRFVEAADGEPFAGRHFPVVA